MPVHQLLQSFCLAQSKVGLHRADAFPPIPGSCSRAFPSQFGAAVAAVGPTNGDSPWLPLTNSV